MENSDFQEVKDSKCRRLLVIGGGIFLGVGILTAIIVPCVIFLPKESNAPPVDPSNVNLLVIQPLMSLSYVIAGDGSNIYTPIINAPQIGYTASSIFAMIRGDLFIFGGIKDSRKKVAKLVGCVFEEQKTTLNYFYADSSAAISIEDSYRALICFSSSVQDENNECEILDTATAQITHSSKYSHFNGKLGMYNGSPTTVGALADFAPAGPAKVEYYSSDGWRSLPDFRQQIHSHTLTGLADGSMIMAGGYYRHQGTDLGYETKDVWSLNKGQWNKLGELKKFHHYGSSIRIGQYIYLVSGVKADVYGNYAVERILVENNELLETEVIGAHTEEFVIPILYEASANFCV